MGGPIGVVASYGYIVPNATYKNEHLNPVPVILYSKLYIL